MAPCGSATSWMIRDQHRFYRLKEKEDMCRFVVFVLDQFYKVVGDFAHSSFVQPARHRLHDHHLPFVTTEQILIVLQRHLSSSCLAEAKRGYRVRIARASLPHQTT